MKTFGLVGYPLSQSFSQKHFTKKFADQNINAQYLNFELENIGLFHDIVEKHPDLEGLNVTIPYKEQIIPLLNDLNPEAKEIGAVNVVKIIRTNNSITFKGYNSDVYGFEYSLKPLLRPQHKKALILGTGGASKAVYFVLNKLGIESKYVSRTPQKNQLAYSEITPQLFQEYKLIVNCTPLGMFPNTNNCPDIPYAAANSDFLFYDLIYNPAETLFLTKAKEQGAAIKNGAEMLTKQAERAWEIWNE